MNDASATSRVSGVASALPSTWFERQQANGLLAALPTAARELIEPHLRERVLREGAVLWDRGERPDRVCFPVSGSISMVVSSPTGAWLEVGTVGLEGAVGFDAGADAPPALSRAVVRMPGVFAQVPARDFAAAARESEELRLVEIACRDWLLAQAQQTALCNAVHSADARVCRWLLRTAEATGCDVVPATQEVVAELLGLRRTTVTLVAQTLQAAGIIRYRRGLITILDREKLRATCGCGAELGPGHWPSVVLAARRRCGGNGHGPAE